jgi:hypothetical protein
MQNLVRKLQAKRGIYVNEEYKWLKIMNSEDEWFESKQLWPINITGIVPAPRKRGR